MNNNRAEIQAQNDYQQALGQAFLRKARKWLRRDCNDLLSFQEVFQFLGKQPQIDLGIKNVVLKQIVGSAGRHHDFDLAYSPNKTVSKERWTGVAAAKYQGKNMPPVILYKVGEAYFVEDGNHRVSVARANKEQEIKARVVEMDVTNLRAEPRCTRLGYKMGKGGSCK